MRRSMNPERHLPTLALVSFNRSAIALLISPSALLRTLRARLHNTAASKRLRAND
jgi:hypothetical protein